MKDLKAREFGRTVGSKVKKEEKKRQKELKKLHEMAQQRVQSTDKRYKDIVQRHRVVTSKYYTLFPVKIFLNFL